MAGIIFTAIISIGIPIIALLYALYKKYTIPFGLGVLAFVLSQVVIRIPLLKYLGDHSTGYLLFSATQPILYALFLGLSAGIFEEFARFAAMHFFMKKRDWTSGFLFGAGHGGVEAVIFVGISTITLMFSPTAMMFNEVYFIGGIERFFAMLLHIGLSIIVLQGVVQKKFRYVVLAIFIHSMIDALVGILLLTIPQDSAILILESTVAVVALVVFSYSLWMKRKGVLT